MPDTRTHRGPHPDDARLFAVEARATLREAAADLAWLLNLGYVNPSALKLDHCVSGISSGKILFAMRPL